ncbi:hypothetical protein HPP92_020541 [Vanilla planifolia]|uniref:Uncharacterized protein n=1 Tax=Vanilla planifolia TaxID=51239 RepID=A0A835PX88_VANPL|nr:hypothetical protein HPP92_020541 [Vanilla planifolia]
MVSKSGFQLPPCLRPSPLLSLFADTISSRDNFISRSCCSCCFVRTNFNLLLPPLSSSMLLGDEGCVFCEHEGETQLPILCGITDDVWFWGMGILCGLLK